MKMHIEHGKPLLKGTDYTHMHHWMLAVQSEIGTIFGNDSNQCRELKSISDSKITVRVAAYLDRLQTIIALTEQKQQRDQLLQAIRPENIKPQSPSQIMHAEPQKKSAAVFIVHGRSERLKETVARFLEKLGLEVIILHEQKNQGLTIIEKFEQHAQKAGFAVVLATRDDVGGLAESPPDLKPRARQNVIYEMGFFAGRLGRSRVAVLSEQNVELPSDLLGVLHLKAESETWKHDLVSEMIGADISVDLRKIFNA